MWHMLIIFKWLLKKTAKRLIDLARIKLLYFLFVSYRETEK